MTRIRIKLALSIILSLVCFFTFGQSLPVNNSVIVVDCGSSGTRLHIWTLTDTSMSDQNFKVSPGLSSFVDDHTKNLSANGVDTQGLKASVDALVAKVPATAKNLSVYVYATAGMRLVRQNAAAEVMQDAQDELTAQGFTTVKSSKVITGAMEGYYDWIGLNTGVIMQQLPAGQMQGALDLGGGSTEISFAVSGNHSLSPSLKTIPFKYGNTTYHIVSQSYLGKGQDQARASIDNAYPTNRASCYPAHVWNDEATGTKNPVYNFDTCQKNSTSYLIQAGVAEQLKPISTAMSAVKQWSAFSGFHYMAQFFNIQKLSDLTPALVNASCQISWSDFVAKHQPGDKQSYLQNYCFSAAYSYALLSNVYKLNAVTFSKNDVDWTEGTALAYFTKQI